MAELVEAASTEETTNGSSKGTWLGKIIGEIVVPRTRNRGAFVPLICLPFEQHDAGRARMCSCILRSFAYSVHT